MKILITGHRRSKLQNYSEDFIRLAISEIVDKIEYLNPIGLAGMADGVDLWFCEEFRLRKLMYWACVPFEKQSEYMNDYDNNLRGELIRDCTRALSVRNSFMVEECDYGIVVWDGNKGGTHNVLQQLIEKKKSFFWINPVNEKVHVIT